VDVNTPEEYDGYDLIVVKSKGETGHRDDLSQRGAWRAMTAPTTSTRPFTLTAPNMLAPSTLPERNSSMTPQQKSEQLQELREKFRKILSGEIRSNSPVRPSMSLEEQRKLGIPTDSASLDLNLRKRP
jgi:hypothetical protein